MAFLYPQFLWLMFAVILPIVIHLFNFHRFKRVFFTNVSILKDLATVSKKQNKIKERLLLLFRCLTIILLSLLFSQPYIKKSSTQLANTESNAVVVVLDNSFSMQNIADKGSMLETAKTKAEDILKEYSDNDVFCLLTMDMEGRHKHFVSKQEFMNFLKDVEISSTSFPYSKLVNSAHNLLSYRNEKSKRLFFISDFQENAFDEQNFKRDTNIVDVFLPLEAKNLDNIYIDTVYLDRNIYQKGQKANINISVKNISEQDVKDVPLKLYIDDVQQSIANVSIPKNSSISVPMTFVIQKNGTLKGNVSVLDNPIVYDDDFYFTLNIKDKIGVLCLNGEGENKYINRLFANSEEVSLQNMNETEIDFSKFANNNLIILNSLQNISLGLAKELVNFRNNNGSILIIPPKKMNLQSYNSALEEMKMPTYSSLVERENTVVVLNDKNDLYKSVFTSVTDNMELPRTKKYYKISTTTNRSMAPIMTFANRDVFLLESPSNTGKAFMFAVPFDESYSDFTSQTIFVPTLWNMVLYAQNLANPFVFMSDNAFIDLSLYTENLDKETITLKKENNSQGVIPQMLRENNRLGFKLNNQIKQDGIYFIFDGEKSLGALAVNYPRVESDLRFMNSVQLRKKLENTGFKDAKVFNDRKMISTYFAQSKKGFDFTYLLLILVLLSIFVESFILWQIKKKQ
ncbi:MAG: BatA and WFA domain-containing protein [Bacteroidales bacterium]|nr:BatA and WFA domain-containing protein [Bacteroidales bacterium]